MDARKIVEEDIKTCIRKAMKLGILSNPRMSGNFFDDRRTISSKYTRFVGEADYLENYSKKYEQGDFFATLEDGAFFQINYEFDVPSSAKVIFASEDLAKWHTMDIPKENSYYHKDGSFVIALDVE